MEPQFLACPARELLPSTKYLEDWVPSKYQLRSHQARATATYTPHKAQGLSIRV